MFTPRINYVFGSIWEGNSFDMVLWIQWMIWWMRFTFAVCVAGVADVESFTCLILIKTIFKKQFRKCLKDRIQDHVYGRIRMRCNRKTLQPKYLWKEIFEKCEWPHPYNFKSTTEYFRLISVESELRKIVCSWLYCVA